MSVLRSLEDKIAGLVEGTFSRAFRAEVRPVEIARRLVREMDLNKSVSVSTTYAPNEYHVYLSPEDRERLAGYEPALVEELPATCSSTRAGSTSSCSPGPPSSSRPTSDCGWASSASRPSSCGPSAWRRRSRATGGTP